MNREVKSKLEEIMEQAVKNREIAGCSLMVLKEGKELFYHQEGYANEEEHVPIYRDTLYRCYSMTKPITGIAAMILLERGKLDLAEPVETYLPGFKGQKVWEDGKEVNLLHPVLVQDLLNMTSGLCYPGDSCEPERQVGKVYEELGQRLLGSKPMTTVEFANRLGQCPLRFQPGTNWMYGTSADVLGAVIEVISGMTLGEFMKKEIFDPLDMKSTGFSVDPKELHRLATAYEIHDGQMHPYTGNHLGILNAMDRKPGFESGGAGLVSCIDDYKNLTQMLLNKGTFNGKRILKSKTVEFFTSDALTEDSKSYLKDWINLSGHSYGNLMRILTQPGRAVFLGSAGEYGWDGWLGCYFTVSPADKLIILFMMQKKDAGTVSVLRKCRNVIFANLT